ncbi:FtsQ-type POTRA domain-containing protein [Kitasatospora sp. GP82]|uniref:cell division protein FtsQ/DivIB n=1 Tax=Kitasatospora sp. GP82 TaxID=3035089 RepID=UPI002473615A|nr:FtsQ-type POTRA domain-containing protein [Kitasatospora sp. GP82]MDH6127204.1 cell division protein FtsQ [Kitasatospora sp. GP82]
MADASVHDPLVEEPESVPRLRLSRRGIVVLSALGALVLGALCWLVYFSSALDVRSVAVQGLESGKLTDGQVREALGSLQHGPLARVDLTEAEHRVEGIPLVAKAEIWRGWPHTLQVKLVERKPVAALKNQDGTFSQVDAGGVSFATEPAAPAGVPVVELALSQQGNDALTVMDRPTLLRAAVTVAAGLPPEVAKRAGVLQVHSYDDIRLQLSGGATVHWGSPERTARKAVVLTALLGQRGTNYDVSAPDAPAVSP